MNNLEQTLNELMIKYGDNAVVNAYTEDDTSIPELVNALKGMENTYGESVFSDTIFDVYGKSTRNNGTMDTPNGLVDLPTVTNNISPTNTVEAVTVTPDNITKTAYGRTNPYSNIDISGNTRNGIDYSDFNSVTGNNDWNSMNGMLGGIDANGFKNTGIVPSALSVGSTLFNGYNAYQGLKATKENNARNYELAKENARRAKTRYNNVVNEKKRKAGLLMGNANNYATTAGVVAANPYSRY